MTTIGRAFVAVVPSAAALDAIGTATHPLHASVPDARWTTRDKWHVTLQFLGNRVDLDDVANALSRLHERGGRARFAGGGAFPSERRGRVLWIGVDHGADLLTRLASSVGTLLMPLGYEPDAAPAFHAHLTLARLQAPCDLRAPIAVLDASTLGPAWDVGEVVLFRSTTRREGAEYDGSALLARA